MGRGRQKAKQTKVARQLKYFSPDTDYDALAKELHGGSSPVGPATGTGRRTDGFDVGERDALNDESDEDTDDPGGDEVDDDDSDVGVVVNGR